MRSLCCYLPFSLLFWLLLNLGSSISLNDTVPYAFQTMIHIGHCDDLVLDARYYYNIGGMNDSNYIWDIFDLDEKRHGVGTLISNDDLTLISNLFIVELTVKHFESSYTFAINITVHKSYAYIVANTQLHGIHEYFSNIQTLFNGIVSIDSSISVESNPQCDNNIQLSLDESEYDINWFVHIESQYDIINEYIWSALNAYLTSQNDINADSLSINTEYMLQSGMNYAFTMNLMYEASNDGTIQSINTTHYFIYKHADIECQIMGGDVHVLLDTLTPFQMTFNGALFTYDTDNVGINHLGFNWLCTDNMNNNCNHILDYTDLSIINANVTDLSISVYTFLLNVDDNDNMYRDNCTDSITMNVSIEHDVYSLIISTTAISHRINKYDKVRIIASVNKEINIVNHTYDYKWFEINALLSDDDIVSYSEASQSSLNLILRSNILSAGTTYAFRLEIYRYNNGILIEHGISGITEIYVMNGAHIVDDSFIIDPECTVITYDSINDYIEQDDRYSLSVVVSGDYLPFLYHFKSVHGSYFHPNVLSAPFIDDIYLSIGENILSIDVYDAESALVTDTIQCDVTLNDYTQCIDNSNEMFNDIDLFITHYDKYMYILHKSHVYLQYIADYKLSDTQCIKEILAVILSTLNDYIAVSTYTFCENNFVILLSQVMQLWIDIAIFDESVIVLFYKDEISVIRNLISAILDPCLYIQTYIGFANTEYLKVSTESMIRNVPKIYYNNEDITSHLSVIQINNEYHDLLYTLTYSLIKLVDIINDRQIYTLLSSSLYIASLASISTSIPGEEISIDFDSFSIFSTKISNDNHENMTVFLHNITVYVPHDIFSSSSLTEPIDIVMVGIETNQSVVSISLSKRCVEQGFVSKDAVSITTIGNHTNPSNLSSNIILEFACGSCDDDYECMWYNPLNDLWMNDGCDTFINSGNNSIICSCSHLTTFATIHNIHRECDSLFREHLFSWKYWDVINLSYASLFLCLAIYIALEIYPFFIDEHLSFKQMSVLVMSILFIICVLHFVTCIGFHDLKYNGFTRVTMNLLTLFLLLSMHLYFIVYCLILFTWFTLAHAMSPDLWLWKYRAKLVLIGVNIIILCMALCIYILSIIIRDSDTMEQLFVTIEIIWSSMLSIVCIIFIFYAVSVGNVLMITFVRASMTQRHAKRDMLIAKKTLWINFFITLFFVIQSVLSIYYTIHNKQFTYIPRIVDLSINALFTILLCVMYRKAMRRMIITEAKHKYNLWKRCKRMNLFKRKKIKKKKRRRIPRIRSNSFLRSTQRSRNARSNAAVGTQTALDVILSSNGISHASNTSYTQSVTMSYHKALPTATCSFHADSTLQLHIEEEEEFEDEIPEMTLEQCLQHDHGYQMFLSHCKKQYCSDVVLAVVEFIQFQNQYNDEQHVVKIPHNLSLSIVVKDDTLSMREKVISLCNKYIVNGSEFELNIGGSTKSDILKAMVSLDRMKDGECTVIFNDCVFAIIALMHDSFIEFQLTNSYEDVKMKLWKDKKIKESRMSEMTMNHPPNSRMQTLTPLSLRDFPLQSTSFTPMRSVSPSPRSEHSKHSVLSLPSIQREESPEPSSKPSKSHKKGHQQYVSLSIEDVKALQGPNKRQREQLLNDQDFVDVFGMTKDEFSKLKPWRQKRLKRQKSLF